MKKITLALFLLAGLIATSGCTSAAIDSSEAGQSDTDQASSSANTVALSDQQVAEGFEYWKDSQEFIYRWATDSERDSIPCYSTYCSFIKVIAADSCRSISYDWNELDSSGQILSQRSSGLSNIEDPESEVAPGIGFVLSDMSQTASYQLTKMECSTGDYDWSLQRDGESDRNDQVSVEVSKVELPNFIGSSTQAAEDWIRSNGYKYGVNASTKLGMNYNVGCRVNNQDTILGQRPSPGSLVEDQSSTIVWFEIDC